MDVKERLARSAGWFPVQEAHVMFRNGSGVCRHLLRNENYTNNVDSYVSVPLRHAATWDEACKRDGLGVERDEK